MKRERKRVFVEEMRLISQESSCMILINMEALKVSDFNCLRSDLWSIDGNMKVVKNNLLKIVLLESGYNSLSDDLNQQTAILYSDDVVSLSKLLYAFMKNNNKITVVGVVYQGEVFESAKVDKFAKLPSLIELQAQIFDILKHGVGRRLLNVLEHSKRRVPDMLSTHANS